MRVSSRTTWLYGPRPTRHGASSEKRRPANSPSTATSQAMSALELTHSFVERAVQIERAVEAQQAKDLLRLPGQPREVHGAAGGARALEQRDQYADAGGVDERHLRHVDGDAVLAAVGQRHHFLLQPRRGR